jgi:hypothetical protein
VLDTQPGAGVTVNGEPAGTRTALAPGDRLRLEAGGFEVLVVAMAG